jgi:flagellar protein FlbD
MHGQVLHKKSQGGQSPPWSSRYAAGTRKQTFAMIKLTRLNNSQILVNPDLIEHVELNTDTVVTLTNGTSFIVKEHAAEILDLIIAFKRSLLSKAAGGIRQHESRLE